MTKAEPPNATGNVAGPQHRLSMAVASAGLRNGDSQKRAIPTGLLRLDCALQSHQVVSMPGWQSVKGVIRGQVTEVYGPPGVGKTTFCMRLAANALQRGEKVVWIDTSFPVVGPRFRDILSNLVPTADQGSTSSLSNSLTQAEMMANLRYMKVNSLPHLLVLLLHPPPDFPPEGSSLLVIDSPSPLFATAFPRQPDSKEARRKKTAWDKTSWASQRRWPVMGDFASKLGKLAAKNNLAAVLTTQTSTAFRENARVTLRPGLSGREWESGIHTRILLFRDWPPYLPSPKSERDLWVFRNLRFAQVLKVSGRTPAASEDMIVPFVIEDTGLREIDLEEANTNETMRKIANEMVTDIITLPKRKHDEIADSEDEDIPIEEFGSDADFAFAEQEYQYSSLLDEIAGDDKQQQDSEKEQKEERS